MGEVIAVCALLISAALYIGIGYRQHRRIRALGDLIPVHRDREASVRNSKEFSASTVATTISLATVVLAIFELAPYLGTWLLWTVVTTATGLLVVRVMAPRVAKRLEQHGSAIPSLHQFLGTAYGSNSLAVICAACTSVGFLGAFATELSVGTRFLAGLVPSIPSEVTVVVLATVGLTYTALGGFRTVVVTDRYQMIGIWLLIGALAVFYAVSILGSAGGVDAAADRIPPEVFDFSAREGLLAFLVGIFVINVPTYLADMSIWQRIASAKDSTTTLTGLSRSVLTSAATWGALVLLACLVPAIVTLDGETNPLILLMTGLIQHLTPFTAIVLFVIVLGLYAAMLSTASTQLIAISHTVYVDVLNLGAKAPRADRREVQLARLIVVGAAVFAVIVVEGLRAAGFSVADLVFAIFGAQLGLVPPVVLALMWDKAKLSHFRHACIGAVVFGFMGGWASAIYGKIQGNADLVFLAPAVSLGLSMVVLTFLGVLTPKASSR